LLGSYIYVYWRDDEAWYRAKVIKFLEVTRKFRVFYDDKTEEKMDLTKEWFLLEDDNLKEQADQKKK
jgi:hypothetical protein